MESAIDELDRRLNTALVAGHFQDAYENFYAENVVMVENGTQRYSGKTINRERQIYYGKTVQYRDCRLLASAVSGDHSFSEWEFDLQHSGVPYKLCQVAVRHWENGLVVEEKFYFNHQLT